MGFPDLIQSIEKVDDMTVKFTLKAKEAPFLANLGMDFASIMSKEYADSLEAASKKEQLNQMPLGTGPFKFVAYQQDAVIRYQAHEGYWKGKEKIDDLVFAITTDAAVRLQKLKAGECHVMPYPNAADVEGMKADANLQVMEAARPEHRLSGLQHDAGAVRQGGGPQRHQHGDQPAGDRRCGVPGRGRRRRRTRSRRRSGPTTTRSRPTNTTRRPPRRRSRRPAFPAFP